MARFDKIAVLSKMQATGVVPVFYNSDAEVAKQVLKACYEGGVRTFEFTNRGDFAHEVFAEVVKFAAKECPDMAIGVGSVVDARLRHSISRWEPALLWGHSLMLTLPRCATAALFHTRRAVARLRRLAWLRRRVATSAKYSRGMFSVQNSSRGLWHRCRGVRLWSREVSSRQPRTCRVGLRREPLP